MNKKFYIVIYYIVIYICLSFIAGLLMGVYLYYKPGDTEQKILYIPTSSSLQKISYILAEEKIIRSKKLFLFYSGVNNLLGRNIKAGEYEVPKRVSYAQLLNILHNGKTVTYRITFPEGLTNYQIGEILLAEKKLAGDIILPQEEGFLFPSTYFYKRGQSRQSILTNMQKNMRNILLVEKKPDNFSMKDILILASIIEKETSIEAEKPLISGVFHNRLRQGIPLQADPSVAYVVSQRKGVMDRNLTKNDLAIDSPFNTYKYKGLPPEAICNPGLSSIKAALAPAEVEYLYFVSNGKKGHNFAKDLNSHNKNVIYYRNITRTFN